jgi:hypothetical protein
MRKLQRSILRHQAYRGTGGIELFHYLWKKLRIKQGKWKFNSKRLNNQQSKTAVKAETGKDTTWSKLINFLKNRGRK